MKEIEMRGSLNSRTWCRTCMKELKSIETSGRPINRAVETLQWTAIHHEQRYPQHEVEVIIYRADFIVPLAEN